MLQGDGGVTPVHGFTLPARCSRPPSLQGGHEEGAAPLCADAQVPLSGVVALPGAAVEVCWWQLAVWRWPGWRRLMAPVRMNRRR